VAQPTQPDDRWGEFSAVPDGELVARVLRGEHDAFALLFDRYAGSGTDLMVRAVRPW